MKITKAEFKRLEKAQKSLYDLCNKLDDAYDSEDDSLSLRQKESIAFLHRAEEALNEGYLLLSQSEA